MKKQLAKLTANNESNPKPKPVMTFETVNGAGEVYRDRDSKEWTINAPEGSERMHGTPSEVRARVEQLKKQAAKPELEPELEPTPVIEFECVECGWITDTVHEQHHHFSASEPDPVRSSRVRVDGVIYDDEEAYFSERADAVETFDELRAAKLDAYTGLLGRVCSTFSAES